MFRGMLFRLAAALTLAALVLGCRRDSQAEPEPASRAEPAEESEPARAPEAPADAPSAELWNYPTIPWRSAEAGLAAMQTSKRPGMVVVMATWCGRCKEYRKLFYDPEVLELSRHFEMILIDEEHSPERAAKWNTDGSYFPRTFFATPSGSVDPSFVTSLPDFPHFFNGQQRAELVATMRRAIAKFAPPG